MSAEPLKTSGDVELPDLQSRLAELRQTEEQLNRMMDILSDHDVVLQAVTDAVEDAPTSARVDDLETEVDDTRQAVRSLMEAVSDLETTVEQRTAALEDRQDRLDDRLSTIEAMFSDNLIDKQDAHRKAQGRDIPLEKGECYELCVEEVMPDQPDPTVRGRLGSVHTFVEVSDPDNIEPGDVLDIVVTAIDDSAVRGLPADEL